MASELWMEGSLVEEKLSNYWELPLPQSSDSKSISMDGDTCSDSGSSSDSSSLSPNFLSMTNHIPSAQATTFHLNRHDRGEETVCENPTEQMPTNIPLITNEFQGYVSKKLDEDFLCSSDSDITSIRSLEVVTTDYPMSRNQKDCVEHNSTSVEINSVQDRTTPPYSDTKENRKSSIDSPTPVVVFDFGASTMIYDPSQEEADDSLAQTPTEMVALDSRIAFDLGSSQLKPIENPSDDSKEDHLPSFSLGLTSPVGTLSNVTFKDSEEYPITASGYVIDAAGGAHRDRSKDFFDFCSSTRPDKSDLYNFNKILGEHKVSLSGFSVSQSFPDISNGLPSLQYSVIDDVPNDTGYVPNDTL